MTAPKHSWYQVMPRVLSIMPIYHPGKIILANVMSRHQSQVSVMPAGRTDHIMRKEHIPELKSPLDET